MSCPEAEGVGGWGRTGKPLLYPTHMAEMDCVLPRLTRAVLVTSHVPCQDRGATTACLSTRFWGLLLE